MDDPVLDGMASSLMRDGANEVELPTLASSAAASNASKRRLRSASLTWSYQRSRQMVWPLCTDSSTSRCSPTRPETAATMGAAASSECPHR